MIGAALLGAVIVAAPPAYGDPAPAAPTTFAGIDTTQIILPGLHLKTRDDRLPEDGGVTLSFADDNGAVHAVVRLAVAKDAASARAFVTTVMRGVSGVLPPSTIDETAFAGDRFVVAARGNVAYVVDALDATLTAPAITSIVKRAITPGAPAFPAVKVSLPPTIDRNDPKGALVTLVAPAATTHHVHATRAYVTHAQGTDSIHALAPGTIEIVVDVADSLARVTEVKATSTAR